MLENAFISHGIFLMTFNLAEGNQSVLVDNASCPIFRCEFIPDKQLEGNKTLEITTTLQNCNAPKPIRDKIEILALA